MQVGTFSSTINKWLQARRVIFIDHRDQRGIDPASSFDAVQSTDDNIKLHVVVFIFVLDLADVGCDIHSLHSLLHKSSGDFSFGLSDICLAEQKLPVEI